MNGVDGAGKGETVNLFNEWMDPRHIHTHAFGAMTDAEREHPEMWRFWRALPPKGRIGILFGSWYTDPILKRVMGHEKRAEFEHRLERIRHFERMLVAEGALLLKLWFHLSKPAQKKRLQGAPVEQEDGLARGLRRLGALQALRRVRRRLRGRAARDEHRARRRGR